MRIDQTGKITLIRFAVTLAIVIASPLLLVAGAPIRRRWLRHACREEAPALIDKARGRVSVHYFVVNNQLGRWLCAPTEALVRPACDGVRPRATDNKRMTHPRIRVAAYVIRHRSVPELLVFDHVGTPAAGTQVPAGGVGPDEEPELAVLREVAEETGLSDVAVVRQVAVEDKPHPESGQPRRTTFFFLRTSTDTPDAWEHRVSGDGEDADLTFACRFLSLPLKHPLADEQDAWLGRIDPLWATPESSDRGDATRPDGRPRTRGL